MPHRSDNGVELVLFDIAANVPRFQRPRCGFIRERHRKNLRLETNVVPDLRDVGHLRDVLLNIGLLRELLRPVPLLSKGEAVSEVRCIEAAAGVRIGPPYATDVRALFKYDKWHTGLVESMSCSDT